MFGQEDAWLLVQADGGNAGFVPENYTEVFPSHMPLIMTLIQFPLGG